MNDKLTAAIEDTLGDAACMDNETEKREKVAALAALFKRWKESPDEG